MATPEEEKAARQREIADAFKTALTEWHTEAEEKAAKGQQDPPKTDPPKETPKPFTLAGFLLGEK